MTEYSPLPSTSDLSAGSLEWAHLVAMRSRPCELHVHPGLERIAFQIRLPLMTIVLDPTLAPNEWYLQTFGYAMGSKGP